VGIRADIAKAPIEKKELQRIWRYTRDSGDFEVAQITWPPIMTLFFTNSSLVRARTFYLFRDEYIFDLERGVVTETPELATPPTSSPNLRAWPRSSPIMRGLPRKTFSIPKQRAERLATWGASCTVPIRAAGSEGKGVRW